jgi:hypothetical protein
MQRLDVGDLAERRATRLERVFDFAEQRAPVRSLNDW